MTAKVDAIRAIYEQVNAPEWAAANLDGLADVLRDLSWLPDGQVPIAVPDLSALPAEDAAALLRVLARAVDESLGSARPLRVAHRD